MKIHVTQKHIDRGLKSEPSACALAVAISEQCPTYEAKVGAHWMEVRDLLSGQCRIIDMPTPANSFVIAFDSGVARPCVLDIAIPSNVTEPVRASSVQPKASVYVD